MRWAAWALAASLLAACDSHGSSSPTASSATERPVAWRGALIVGGAPATHEPEVEAGWQAAVATNGAGNPSGWTIDLVRGFVTVPGCPTAHCDGVTIPATRTIQATADPSRVGDSNPLTEIMTFEFCHLIWLQRTGNPLSPNCPI